MKRHLISMVVVVLVGSLGAAHAVLFAADDEDAEFAQEQIERWMTFYEKEATDYEIVRDGDPEKKLELVRKPVMRWTNPVIGNGSTHGACFVWTHEGRPEVFASIFSYIPSKSPAQDKRVVAHAFHSLSPRPLVAKRAGARFWYPDEAGIAPSPVPGAPEPAKTARLRLVQMRNLAREFTATSGRGDNLRELRLMTQPTYRYQPAGDDVLDGALFCFVTGTDPELLLLIEARMTDEGGQWHYAGARHSHLTLRLHHNQKEVWTYVRGGSTRDPRHRYRSVHGVSVHDKFLE